MSWVFDDDEPYHIILTKSTADEIKISEVKWYIFSGKMETSKKDKWAEFLKVVNFYKVGKGLSFTYASHSNSKYHYRIKDKEKMLTAHSKASTEQALAIIGLVRYAIRDDDPDE
jgi:hypothetical protein